MWSIIEVALDIRVNKVVKHPDQNDEMYFGPYIWRPMILRA